MDDAVLEYSEDYNRNHEEKVQYEVHSLSEREKYRRGHWVVV